jgi:hypothetical protein
MNRRLKGRREYALFFKIAAPVQGDLQDRCGGAGRDFFVVYKYILGCLQVLRSGGLFTRRPRGLYDMLFNVFSGLNSGCNAQSISKGVSFVEGLVRSLRALGRKGNSFPAFSQPLRGNLDDCSGQEGRDRGHIRNVQVLIITS